MYAVELHFVDGQRFSPAETAIAVSVQYHARGGTARIEHLRIQRDGGTTRVVLFLAAANAADARTCATTIGLNVAAQLRPTRFVALRIWAGGHLDSEEAAP